MEELKKQLDDERENSLNAQKEADFYKRKSDEQEHEISILREQEKGLHIKMGLIVNQIDEKEEKLKHKDEMIETLNSSIQRMDK